MAIRARSWILAAIVLVAFCWLGLVAASFAPVFAGLESVAPLKTRLLVAYGSVACPLVGIGAAVSLILADLFCWPKWVRSVLVVALVIMFAYIFDGFLFSYFGPVPRLTHEAVG